MPSNPDWVVTLSEELFANPTTLASYRGRPLSDLPTHCWLTPRTQVRVGGTRQSIRYAVYTYVTGRTLGYDRKLLPGRTCISGACCNPQHQTVVARPRPGPKPDADCPAPPPVDRTDRKSWQFGVEWPDADRLPLLLVMPADLWPAEARTRCWNWTGYTLNQGLYQNLPRIGKESAAHALWELHNRRELPPRTILKRTCRNRRCVNPHHAAVISRGQSEEPPVTAVTEPPTPPNPPPQPAPKLVTPVGLTVDEASEDIEYWWEMVQTPTVDGFLRFLAGRHELFPYRIAAKRKGGPLTAICEAIGWK